MILFQYYFCTPYFIEGWHAVKLNHNLFDFYQYIPHVNGNE